MKKAIVATTLIVALIIVAGVFAGGKGAVSGDLTGKPTTPGDPTTRPVVGQAIASTTPNGVLIVKVHIDKAGVPNALGRVVKINGHNVGRIHYNAQGNGNAIFKVDIPEGAADPFEVKVSLFLGGGGRVQGPVKATLEVPLK